MDFNIATTREEELFRQEVQEFVQEQAEDIQIASRVRSGYGEAGSSGRAGGFRDGPAGPGIYGDEGDICKPCRLRH